jgi:hypothetical protein
VIIQVPTGGSLDRQLSQQPSRALSSGRIVVESGPTDARGQLEPPFAGEVVLSVPSPETLVREASEVRRVIEHAGSGVDPLVVVVEAAEELRDEELAAVIESARHAPRPVILRVIRDA